MLIMKVQVMLIMKVQVMLKKLKVLVMKKLKHMSTKLMSTHLSECMLLTLDMAILRYFYICLISVPTDMILTDMVNLDTNRTLHTSTQQDTVMNMHLNTHMNLDTNRNLDTSTLMKLPTEQERCRIAALC